MIDIRLCQSSIKLNSIVINNAFYIYYERHY